MEIRIRMKVMMTLFMMTRSLEAQSTECVNSLMPCGNYLKWSLGVNPPASCCNPLKEADKECLCSIFTNAALLHSLGATPSEASKLPGRCNITGASPNTCSSSPTPPASTNSPPAASGKNGGDIVAWTGVSFGLALVTSFLFYLN